jgi:hypothetical protein
MNRRFVSVLVVATITGFAAGDESSPHSVSTRAAHSGYDRRVSEIEANAHEKLIGAAHDYVKLLKVAQAEAIKSDNIDEALRIRDEIRRVELPLNQPNGAKRAAEEDRRSLFEKLIGTTWDNDGHGGATLNADGTVTRADGVRGQWSTLDGHTLIAFYADNWADVWAFDKTITSFHALHDPLGRSYSGKQIK